MPLSDSMQTVRETASDHDDRFTMAATLEDFRRAAAAPPVADESTAPVTRRPPSNLVVARTPLPGDPMVSPAARQLAAAIAQHQLLNVDLGRRFAVPIARSIAIQTRPLVSVLNSARTTHAMFAPVLAFQRRLEEVVGSMVALERFSLRLRFGFAPRVLLYARLTEDLSRRVRVLLQGWRLAELVGGVVSGWLRDVGRWGLAAARRARAAVLYGDDEELLVFIEVFLGLVPTPTVVEAVSMVLLTEDWLAGPVEPDEAREVLGWLRRRAIQQHRVHKPVWMTQVRGRPVRLLEQPVALGGGRFAELSELLPDPGSIAPFAAVEGGYADVRLARLVVRLTPQERAVVDAYAAGAPSWAQAARAAGLPAEFGDVVRRRAQHHRDRVAAQLPELRPSRPLGGQPGGLDQR